jgi:hydrogenase maturation protease
MKPTLLIGLGNPLMGDDGVGCAVAERLAHDPRLPDSAEVICGGSDLLRYAAQMEGRSRVLVLDAIQDGAEPGGIFVFADGQPGLDDHQDHAHHLSAVQAIRLLEAIAPIRCTLVGIAISSAAMADRLSPAVEARMPAIVDRVLEEVERWLV